MAKEIERKFLVVNDSYKSEAIASHDIAQGYLSTNPEATVRVRIRDDRAFLTVKGITVGAVRDEWEYEIPVTDARGMLDCCGNAVLSKTRMLVPAQVEGCPDAKWEVDVFHGKLAGLVVAEIELPNPDTPLMLPSFVGKEVTGDVRYYNSSLVEASEVPAP